MSLVWPQGDLGFGSGTVCLKTPEGKDVGL